MTFMEKLKHSSQVNRSLVCVGLDPGTHEAAGVRPGEGA